MGQQKRQGKTRGHKKKKDEGGLGLFDFSDYLTSMK